MAKMKESTKVEVSEYDSSGSVTRRSTDNWDAPDARAASSKLASIPMMGPRIIRYAKGTWCSAITKMMPI